ncbi:MAG: gluconolactonase [Candidatus Aeolococcus gillhamiae]|uniref:Gluconolactonase n=1 Tax=Candidatus Aeolococcus gillhamiae TaxID=3127015 RepID=A0A2W5ZCE1_9BACT|nr:MAG: gluconolactonase [Candidatus Dormibacter sp. RRmetagenome_bin12]
MPDRAFRTLAEGGAYFEGPRWRDGKWWVSDMYRHAVFSVTPDGAETEVVHVEGQPSGLGWLPDGSLLVASMRDHRLLRRDPDGTMTVHADLSAVCTGLLNDLVVDHQGRAWVGDFGFDLYAFDDPVTTSLKRVDPDGSLTIAARDLIFPNGTVITPDGRTLIVGETLGNRYTSFHVADDGSLQERAVWAQLGPEVELGDAMTTLGQLRVAPDGCTLDAENRIWVADGIGGRCIRVAQGGEIVYEVKPPGGLGVFACALGGESGTTLLLCCAPDYFENNRREAREAVLITTEVSVPHAGLP